MSSLTYCIKSLCTNSTMDPITDKWFSLLDPAGPRRNYGPWRCPNCAIIEAFSCKHNYPDSENSEKVLICTICSLPEPGWWDKTTGVAKQQCVGAVKKKMKKKKKEMAERISEIIKEMIKEKEKKEKKKKKKRWNRWWRNGGMDE